MVNHNVFFEHFSVARYWHDESSCTTLAELKMDSCNLSIPMHINSNITRRCWEWKYTLAEAEKYQQDKDAEKEPVSKDLETLQLPQNLDQQTLEIFPHVHLASIKWYAHGFYSPTIRPPLGRVHTPDPHPHERLCLLLPPPDTQALQ